jgi:hypothetical protein
MSQMTSISPPRRLHGFEVIEDQICPSHSQSFHSQGALMSPGHAYLRFRMKLSTLGVASSP